MKKLMLAYLVLFSLKILAQEPIAEFNFDATLHNTKKSISFVGVENYVDNRIGDRKSALRLTNKSLEVKIDNLPQNSSPRTISIWIKMNDIIAANYIWGYGSAHNSQYFGLLQQGTISTTSDLSLAGWGATNDVIVNTPVQNNIWYNYTVTFDGKTSKIYRNGYLIKSEKGTSRNTKGKFFRLGAIDSTVSINADIDDLKIYNVALSEEQILKVYTLSPFERTAVPVTEEKEIKTITTAAVKSSKEKKSSSTLKKNAGIKYVEIFSQGEKILSNNSQEINMNNLPEGTYLLKVTNVPAKKATAK